MTRRFLLFFLLTTFTTYSQQDTISSNSSNHTLSVDNKSITDKFSVSGYILPQFQVGERDALLNVGGPNNNPNKSCNRFGLREGRIKVVYKKYLNWLWASSTFQVDLTERGVKIKDAYLSVGERKLNIFSIDIGAFDRPFGREISYSAYLRESPERSMLIRNLFPGERDVGAKLVAEKKWGERSNSIKLEMGVFSGNGVYMDMDNKKDFIGHLSTKQAFGNSWEITSGVSYYNGRVYQGSENVFYPLKNGFYLDTNVNNLGDFAKREYIGFDINFNYKSKLGETKLMGEYIWGKQPGSMTSSKSPDSDVLPTHDTYLRKFQGVYGMLVQDLGKIPLKIVVKYEYYDPNRKIKGNKIGLLNSRVGDVAYQMYGVGLNWQVIDDLRLIAYYEWFQNEKTNHISGFERDRKDNVFTLRLEYKFNYSIIKNKDLQLPND